MDYSIKESTRSKWEPIIKECLESDLPNQVWLKEHNVSEAQFYKYKKLLFPTESKSAETSSINFEEVPLPKAVPHQKATLKVNHISIEVDEEISDSFLAKLMKVASHV